MVRPPQTARSERTREALRQAALVRFLAQGVEATSAEQIAEDAGVSLRTFYRHFRSKHDLLFADYDAGLHWFRAALDARPADESIIDSVQAAIFSFPYDVDAVTKIASLRRGELEPSRIVRHMREVEADFADAIQAQLRRRNCDIAGAPDARLHIAVTARCVAAAVFGAMEAWMLGSDRSLGELARVCHVALESLRVGISDTWTTLTVFVIIDKTSSACEPALLETRMTGYDAIVIGAGHNGLTAAVLLQRAGLRTACLDAKRYAGGMASTVELFDGYRFEIAGSVQFPTSSAVSSELGLDSLPTVDLEVMSVALRGVGDDPVVQFTDPTKMLTHLHRVHGADAVTGMAGLLAWSQAPTRALGRFEAGTLPKSFDEMYACVTNEFERSAIDDMLFGSVTDVLDRHFPDREKHGALRGSMTVLAVNTLYRGPATPGSAAALAFGLGVPEGDFVRWKKLRGGIGALTTHLSQLLERTGGEVRLRSKVTEIVVDNSRSSARVRGVRTAAGDTLTSPIVVSAIAPDVTINELIDPAVLPSEIRDRYLRIDHRGSYLQMHFALAQPPAFAAPYQALNDPSMQASMGIFCTPEQVQQQWEDCRRGIVPADPTVVLQIPSLHDPSLAPAGKQAASAFAMWFPIEGGSKYGGYGRAKVEMGQNVIDKITRLAPNFKGSILRYTTFTPKHMGVMFGAPGGDYCHALLHSDQIGPNRPGPKGFIGQPIPIAGLYLGSAGCPRWAGNHVHPWI